MSSPRVVTFQPGELDSRRVVAALEEEAFENSLMDQDDVIVRRRLGQKLEFLFKDLAEQVEPGDCASEQRVVRTWTATDRCGNATTARQVIEVVATSWWELAPPSVHLVGANLFGLSMQARYEWACGQAAEPDRWCKDASINRAVRDRISRMST